MTLSRSWYSNVNVAASDTSTAPLAAKSLVWGFKNQLVTSAPSGGGAWSVVSSNDGTGGFGNNDDNDRWTTSFDSTKIVRAAAGVNHSWIVLKSPVALGPYYLCLDFVGAADNLLSASFSKNTYTGGTATAAPTSTNSITMAGATVTFFDNTANPHKMQTTMDANGNFWFMISKNGTGFFYSLWGIQTLVETRAGDSWPVFSFNAANGSSRGAGEITNTQIIFNSGGAAAAGGGVGGRGFGGAATVQSVPIYSSMTVSGTAAYFQDVVTTSNAADSTYDGLPAFVVTTTASNMGIRGRIPDVYQISDGAAVGSSHPNSTSQEHVVVGNLLIPFTAVGAPSL